MEFAPSKLTQNEPGLRADERGIVCGRKARFRECKASMKKISIFFSLFRGKIQIGSNEPARNAKAMRHIRALCAIQLGV